MKQSDNDFNNGTGLKPTPKSNRRLVSKEGAKVHVQVHGKSFCGEADGDAFSHDSYADWKELQRLKGTPDWLVKNWELTREKQIKQWDFASVKAGDTLLEVGFRDGFNLQYLQSIGVDAIGIDVNTDAVTHAKSMNLTAYEEDIQQRTRFGDKQFDVISACDVLEHCYDVEGALLEMGRILASQGRLVVEIPFETEFAQNVAHGHSFLFHNDKTARNLFGKANFTVVKTNLENPARNLYLLAKAQ